MDTESLSDSATVLEQLANVVSSSLPVLGFYKTSFHSLAVGSAGLATSCLAAGLFRSIDIECVSLTAALSMTESLSDSTCALVLSLLDSEQLVTLAGRFPWNCLHLLHLLSERNFVFAMFLT